MAGRCKPGGDAEGVLKLEQTPEGNLWRILCKGGDAPGEEVRPDGYRQVGLVVVYVDDLMVLAEPHAKHSFLKRLKEEWTCSTPEEVDHEGWVRFCGFELQWSGRGDHKKLKVGQQSYTRDLLNRHQVEHPRPVPMTKADAERPEEEQGNRLTRRPCKGDEFEIVIFEGKRENAGICRSRQKMCTTWTFISIGRRVTQE